jgi:hypothetical protein
MPASSGGRRRSGTPRRPQSRAPYRYNRAVRDAEFVQRVRRHAPSSMVPLVASYGAAFADRKAYLKAESAVFAPWVLAEVARVSLLYGTEFNRKPATADDLLSCCAAYQALRDPELGHGGPDAVGRFLLRIAGEQLTFQQSMLNDLSRPVALLEQTAPRKPPTVATPGWPERLLGCTLQEYVGAAILLHTGALRNAGIFDLDWLSQPQMEEVTREVPADVLRRVIEEQYAATPTRLRSLQDDAEARSGTPGSQYRRFGFNPLSSRPAVAGLTGGLFIPVPGYVVRKASPLGIYYAGLDKWDTPFAADLGEPFEAYVGRQLRLLPDATVFPEIAYGRKKGKDSVDWFAVFDDCVVLVEVKSTRPTEPVRLADDRIADTLGGILSRAVRQLNTSASLVRSREQGFEDIPSDNRPLVGLVVTMEPFHTVNTPFTRDYLPACDIPYRVCSALELEQLVTVSDISAGRLLLDHLTDPQKDGWSVQSALTGHQGGRNQIIDDAWATYPWKSEPEEPEPS